MQTMLKPFEPLSGPAFLGLLTLMYAFIGALFLVLLGANPLALIQGLVLALPGFVRLASVFAPTWAYIVLAIALVLWGKAREFNLTKILQIVAAIMYCSIFTLMFSLVKNKLTMVVPFWADDMFTQLDLFLHFGHNPRDFLAGLSRYNTHKLYAFYMNSWVFVATFLPVLLIAFDRNETRVRQFIGLWAICWIGLGNIMALIFMSAGPIFAGLATGVDVEVHRSVVALLERPDAKALLAVRDDLWGAYAESMHMVGSGISAFPSVHVGMATVCGLYLLRLGRDHQNAFVAPMYGQAFGHAMRLAALGLIGAFLVLSVYLGWHYAVDGYASLFVISVCNWMMLRREVRVPVACAPIPAE